MPELKAVAKRFDRLPMWDAYTGERLPYECQMTANDGARRDGPTTLRRHVMTSEEVQLPDRHAVFMAGSNWLLSFRENFDGWGKDLIRKGYTAQLAYAGLVSTTDEITAGKGLKVFLSRMWIKDVKDISTDSEGQSQYMVYFAAGEPITEGAFVYIDKRWHIVRNIITGVSFMHAEVNELEPDCVIEVNMTTKGRDPVTEKPITSTFKFPAVYMKWRDDYDYILASHEVEQVGDLRLRVTATSAALIAKDSRMEFKGFTWQVVSKSVRPDGSYSLAVRRV